MCISTLPRDARAGVCVLPLVDKMIKQIDHHQYSQYESIVHVVVMTCSHAQEVLFQLADAVVICDLLLLHQS